MGSVVQHVTITKSNLSLVLTHILRHKLQAPDTFYFFPRVWRIPPSRGIRRVPGGGRAPNRPATIADPSGRTGAWLLAACARDNLRIAVPGRDALSPVGPLTHERSALHRNADPVLA